MSRKRPHLLMWLILWVKEQHPAKAKQITLHGQLRPAASVFFTRTQHTHTTAPSLCRPRRSRHLLPRNFREPGLPCPPYVLE